MKKLLLTAFVLSIVLASVSVSLGTAQLVYTHGHILDPDARSHVAALLSGTPAQSPSTSAALVTPQVTKTATPSPTPQPVRDPRAIILMVFGKDGTKAVQVASCVSGLRPSLVSNGHYGLFQLRPATQAASPYPTGSLLDPTVNAHIAYWLYVQSGYQWYRWGACAPPATTPTASVPPMVQALLHMAFGSYAQQALQVATCESSLRPDAYNPAPVGGSHAEGLFQILYPSTWQTTSQYKNSPYSAEANVQAAFEIFRRDGFSWREWVCQPQ